MNTKDVAGVSGERLKSFIERIEKLEEEKAVIADHIKDVYGESKSVGFDNATLRKIIKLRKMSTQQRQEQEAMLDVYMSALGLTLEDLD